MKVKLTHALLLFCSLVIFSSCETTKEREAREFKEEQLLIEKAEKKAKEERIAAEYQRKLDEERRKREEEERIQREERLEKERREQAIYDRYINNSLRTGFMPYANLFGSANGCDDSYGCSQISVRTPSSSDVLVTIKEDGEVYRHAYIRAGREFTFNLPSGVYQPFFYYGNGWNPEKVMKQTAYGPLKGGFISSEHYGKDSPQSLSSSILSYELILQQNGNFSSKPSNSDEAF